MFTPGLTEPDIAHLAREVDVPAPLGRLALFDEVEGLRQDMVDGKQAAPVFLTPDRPAFRIRYRTAPSPAPFAEALACDREPSRSAIRARSLSQAAARDRRHRDLATRNRVAC